MEQLKITKIENPFDRKNQTVEILPYKRYTLLELKEMYYKDIPVIVSIKGMVVSEEYLSSTYLMPNDWVLFVPPIEGGDDSLRIIASLALIAATIFAPYIPVLWGAAAWTGTAAAVASALVGVVGGYLMNVFLPPVKPDTGDITRTGYDRSNIYSWNPQTTQSQGIAVPKFYGLLKVYGNIISAYTENLSDKNYINVLLSLGLGPINKLYDFKVNDQSTEDLKGVTTYTRYGDLTQALIPNFNDTKTEYATNVNVTYESPYTYRTTGNAFDGLEVDVNFPRGLYYANDRGGLNNVSIQIKVEIKKVGDSIWTPISQSPSTYIETSYDGKWSLGRWLGQNEYGTGNVYWEEIQAGTTIESDHYEGESFSIYDASGYAYYYYWRWITTATETTVETTVDYTTITNATTSAFIKTFKSNSNLPHGLYDIKITRTTADYGSSRYGADTYLSAVREIVTDDFMYPRNVLVGINALASDQLSGSLRFSCMMEGSLIRYTTDGSTWLLGYNNNPAWVCYDVLTQPVFDDPDQVIDPTDNKNYTCILDVSGSTEPHSDPTHWKQIGELGTAWVSGTSYTARSAIPLRYDGINPSRIDTTSFLAWANWCDEMVDDGAGSTEKRFTFNGGFDSQSTLWESVAGICLMSRAFPIWDGTTIKIVVDKAVTLATDVKQLFSVGNIYTDSFEETFSGSSERLGELEINYIDSDSGYEKSSFTVFNTTVDKPTNRSNMTLIGTTSGSQAWRIGTYLLAYNQYLIRTIKFDVDVDALATTVGDVFYFQHDVPRWGLAGGRVVSSTNNTVVIDTEVTIEAGKTYTIMIWLSDDTLASKSVINSPGTTSTLVISGAWTTNPSKYDKYAFGETDTEAKPFRCFQIDRQSNMKCSIMAIEYDANVYAVDSGTSDVPTITYSALKPIAVVTSLTLTESAGYNESGVLERNIIVKFKKPNNPLYSKAFIYYREYSATVENTWNLSGETLGLEYSIRNVLSNITYEVIVISVSFAGIRTTFYESPSTTITTGRYPTAYDNAYDRITGLQLFNQQNDYIFQGKDCKFVWNPITSITETDVGAGDEATGAGSHLPAPWFLDYEVRIYNSTGTTLRRTEYVQVPEYVYSFEKNYEDGSGTPVREFEIQVRARDRSFRVSRAFAKLSVSNEAPIALTDITVSSGTGYYVIEFSPSTAPDLLGYKVYASQTTGFTPDNSTLVNEGTDTRVIVSPSQPGLWYIRVAAYDTFGSISLNYSSQYIVNVTNWLEYDDIELEFMKMSFNSVSWAQFAIFDDFVTEAKRESPDPFPYEAIIYKNSIIVPDDALAETVYGWTTKTYNDVTTVEIGTSTSTGLNFLTDTSKSWYVDELKNLTLVDVDLHPFTITSNTSDTITISGTPAAGAYQLKDSNPAYMVCFCSFEDSTEGGGSGYVKMEVSFDDGANWQTVLDTENGIDSLEGTLAIANTGVDYKVKFSLKTDTDGDGPIVKKYLVCTDPSPWRY